ncbi:glycosyltransferase family 39 protein [Nocardia sp. NPDC004604]|uniref:glycosyltransferase family 39 protein n=1 Tax=Nocardia sp. NPDC004604 TaxID=3157013 RepID=UPI0033A3E932
MTDLMESEVRQRESSAATPPFAWLGVGAIAAVAAIMLFASLGRYGFFGDELYFLSAGRRLAFGYADQGPVLPAIARLMDLIAPGSLVALRIPAALVTVAAVLISAQIAREFGGSRNAQVLTAVAYATSPFLLVQGTQLATNTIDTALWVLISWLLIRWVRTRRDSLLLWAALATALDIQVKWLIPFFWVAVAIGVAIYGPRELLRRPVLWVGAGLVVLVTVPTLIWQIEHDWPQLRLGAVVAAEQSAIGGRYTWLPLALAFAGLFGGVLLISGIWALLRWESLRPYRFLAVVPPLLTVAFIATNGRPYYAAGCYAAVMAAGAVRWTANTARRRRYVTVVLVAVSAAIGAFSMPWQPESSIDPVDSPAEASFKISLYGRFGWPELREATADAYLALPEAQRSDAVIIADSYWQASALDIDRQRYGLPAVYSPNRGFGYFGTPPDSATTVLWVGNAEDEMHTACSELAPVGRVDARLGYPDATRNVTIWRCTPRQPWSRVWPDMLRLD